jgi:hypothetical protein
MGLGDLVAPITIFYFHFEIMFIMRVLSCDRSRSWASEVLTHLNVPPSLTFSYVPVWLGALSNGGIALMRYTWVSRSYWCSGF